MHKKWKIKKIKIVIWTKPFKCHCLRQSVDLSHVLLKYLIGRPSNFVACQLLSFSKRQMHINKYTNNKQPNKAHDCVFSHYSYPSWECFPVLIFHKFLHSLYPHEHLLHSRLSSIKSRMHLLVWKHDEVSNCTFIPSLAQNLLQEDALQFKMIALSISTV